MCSFIYYSITILLIADAETQCSTSPYCEEQICDGDGCSCPDGFYIDEDSQKCFGRHTDYIKKNHVIR